MKCWLMKSEPEVYSIDQLKTDSTTWWGGVRNYQARNFMTEMQLGDLVLFYHSNAEPPGVAGTAIIVQSAKPDESQFDKKSDYFDAKASNEKPRWFCPQLKFHSKFKKIVSLDDLRNEKKLNEILVIKKGQRLSVQPVSFEHFEIIKKMGEK